MAGDSTMALKHPKDFPETGWGLPFSTFFNEAVTVQNLAKNGRSTRTFIEEGLWQQIVDAIKPADVVIIQFGHNDQSEHKQDRYTTPEQYRKNLRRFIEESQARGASVLLLTPVIRRHFDNNGKLKQTHPYLPIVRTVARELASDQLVFVDMEKMTRAYFELMGERDSRLRFMHLDAGLHPNYPIGMIDDTHFSELGAREVAQLFLRALRDIDHRLVEYLREADPKHLKQ